MVFQAYISNHVFLSEISYLSTHINHQGNPGRSSVFRLLMFRRLQVPDHEFQILAMGVGISDLLWFHRLRTPRRTKIGSKNRIVRETGGKITVFD